MQQRRSDTPPFVSGWLFGDAYIVRILHFYNSTSGCCCEFVLERSAYDGTAVQYANVKGDPYTNGTETILCDIGHLAL